MIAAVIRGDTDQYRVLLGEYGVLVRSFLAARLRHLEDVDDLAQQVFIVAFKKLDRYDGPSFRAWIIGIARFELNNHLRK